MDEDTEYGADDITYDAPLRAEYDSVPSSPGTFRTILTGIGGAILAAVAGYLIGWTVGLVMDRIVNGAGS